MTKNEKKGSDISKNTKQDTLSDIEGARQKLQNQINTVNSKLSEIASGIEKPEQKKSQAKNEYEHCLDIGNEEGMKSALAAIRSSNNERENLIMSLAGPDKAIKGIDLKHSELLKKARICLSEAEERLKLIRDEFKNVQLKYDQCRDLLIDINDLRDKLAKIMDSFAQQNSEKKIEPTVE